MKLKDFLKEFDSLDPESEVYFQMSVGCCGDTQDLEGPMTYTHVHGANSTPPYSPYVVVNFPSFDFLNSCKKFGAVSRINEDKT